MSKKVIKYLLRQMALSLERWFTLILFFYQCIVPAWLGRAQPDLQLVNVFNTEAHPFEKAAFDPVLIKERLSLE